MGMIIKLNLVFRIGITLLFTLIMALVALANPGDQHTDAWWTAATMGALLLFSNWQELVETAAHMAHHMPHKHTEGVEHEGNHEPRPHQGR